MKFYHESHSSASEKIPAVIDFNQYRNSKFSESEKEDSEKESSYLVATTPQARARTCAREESSDLYSVVDGIESVYEYYCDVFDRRRVAPAVRRDIASALSAGADLSLIIYALDQASLAPSPSWSYATTVISRCIADGCFDRDAAEKRSAAFRAQFAQKKRPKTAAESKPHNDFSQRSYTEPDFDNFYLDVTNDAWKNRKKDR